MQRLWQKGALSLERGIMGFNLLSGRFEERLSVLENYGI